MAAVDAARATILVKKPPGRLPPASESSRMLATRSSGSRRSFKKRSMTADSKSGAGMRVGDSIFSVFFPLMTACEV